MEWYFVEFSPQQDCFHISTASEMLESNRRALSGGRVPQYYPIACAGNYEKAVQYIQACREMMA